MPDIDIEQGRALLAKGLSKAWAHPDRVKFRDWLDDNAEALLSAAAERDQIAQENTRLRAALAQSDQPCAYCSLPADEWEKCAHGFPGCDRADDAMGCPELGARMELEKIAQRVRAETIEECAKVADGFRCGGCGMDGKAGAAIRSLSENEAGER